MTQNQRETLHEMCKWQKQTNWAAVGLWIKVNNYVKFSLVSVYTHVKRAFFLYW